MALGARRNAVALAIALTDELKNDLYFLSEAQRLDFNGLRLLIWTFICSYAYFKLNLKGKKIRLTNLINIKNISKAIHLMLLIKLIFTF